MCCSIFPLGSNSKEICFSPVRLNRLQASKATFKAVPAICVVLKAQQSRCRSEEVVIWSVGAGAGGVVDLCLPQHMHMPLEDMV
jgi:hypothetical protein